MQLPPASAAIFTSYLFHSTASPGSRQGGIRRQPHPHARPPESVDARIVGIVDAPLVDGEGLAFGLVRKEAELLALFASLTVAQTRALHVRVWNPRSTDPIAAKLQRLGNDRKASLVSFLGRHRAYR